MEYVYILIYENHIVKKEWRGITRDLLAASTVLMVCRDRQKIEDFLDNYPEVLLHSPFGYRVSPTIETKKNKEWRHSEYHIVERELE